MNGNKIILDTNIIIYILSWNEDYINKYLDKEIYVSVISELEVLSYNFESKKDEEIARSFFRNVNIIDISYEIKELVISIKKQNKVKLPDSIILATSLFLDIKLETEDIRLKNSYTKIISKG